MGASGRKLIPRESGYERVYRGLLRLYPAAFRARFADEMVQLFGDQLRDARTGGAPAGVVRTWFRTFGDLAVTAVSEHARRDRTVAHSLTASPNMSNRVLGLVGILGGAALLVPFLPLAIAQDLAPLRIATFNVGAIAIIIAVHRRQSSIAPAPALLSAVAALVANASHAAWLFLAAPGEFGLVGFYAGIALWLTDAAFGLVALRLGVVTRWGALALAIGSILAVTGIDRLGLTSSANPTIFGPLSLTGGVLSGLGWILLGLDVATRRRSAAPGQPVQPEAGGSTR
jgi:hypothetical protein